MTSYEWIGMHLYLLEKDDIRLEEAKEITGIPKYMLVNFILVYATHLVKGDMDIKVQYDSYIRVKDNTDAKVKRPYVKLHRAVHFLSRNIKNRNFRTSIALLVRMGIDLLLDKVIEDILAGKLDVEIFKDLEKKKDHGLYFYHFSIRLSLHFNNIKPIYPPDT